MNEEPSLVTTEWLAAHLGEPNVRVADASWHLPQAARNARAEYEAAHIPGAVFFDIDALSDRATDLPHMLPSPEVFASGIRNLGLGDTDFVVLYDGAGKDRYEAGNFSQGGGYYFGIGMLRDAGTENDVYIGSRYNQGFAAHEAIGFFEEMGGDDLYTTRQAVAQGVSWDETITAFIDHAGDDQFPGHQGRYYKPG